MRINVDEYDIIPVKCVGNNPPTKGITSFDEAKLNQTVRRNVEKARYMKPTLVQKWAIPCILKGRDLMSCAQTGCGKTTAFLLPVLSDIIGLNGGDFEECTPFAIVIGTTRELVIQIHKESLKFSHGTIIKSCKVYEGASQLEKGPNIVIGTPGCLLASVGSGKISLVKVKYLILDEADRMLDMGYEGHIRKLFQMSDMPPKTERQTLIFSTTFPAQIQQFASDFLNDYLLLTIGTVEDAITPEAFQVDQFSNQEKDILNETDETLLLTSSEEEEVFKPSQALADEDEDGCYRSFKKRKGKMFEGDSDSSDDTQQLYEGDGMGNNAAEGYFECHEYQSVTSDRTMDKVPRMDAVTFAKILEGVECPYKEERQALFNRHRSKFNTWMIQMCHGFNILLHGLGSKRQLMEEYRQNILYEYSHIVINGFFPGLTIKKILNDITEDIIEHQGHFRNPIDQVKFIKEHYECGEHEDFYMVINNIDGPMLRDDKTQMVFSLLAQIRGFHIIASIDHINAPLLWDQIKMSRFNWLWNDCTTFENYTKEMSYENSFLVQQSGALTLSSLIHIANSLTPNTLKIFILLAKYQLDNKENGLSFADLYARCRQVFLVNSDLSLKTHLSVFWEHQLIKNKKGVDGTEILKVMVDHIILKEFVDIVCTKL